MVQQKRKPRNWKKLCAPFCRQRTDCPTKSTVEYYKFRLKEGQLSHSCPSFCRGGKFYGNHTYHSAARRQDRIKRQAISGFNFFMILVLTLIRNRITLQYDFVLKGGVALDENYERVRRIMRATNRIDGVYYLLARHYGLNENTLAFLYALDDGKPHSQKEISDEWLIPRTTINSIVKKMISDGYITFTGEQHAKEKMILLTEKGLEYINRLLNGIYLAEERAIVDTLENYSPEFVEALEHFSHCLRAGFDEMVKKEV